MVIQNQLALHILLPKEGRVCRLLKVQHCCAYVPDRTKDLDDFIKNISDLNKDLKNGAWETISRGLSSATNWLGNLGNG